MNPWTVIGWFLAFVIGASLIASLGLFLEKLWDAMAVKIQEQRQRIKAIEDADL